MKDTNRSKPEEAALGRQLSREVKPLYLEFATGAKQLRLHLRVRCGTGGKAAQII